ncbi:hypothetical protein GMOD_00002738 [Pyrenophora seminiperda CCB06]|uniref:Uncharacterized protein n=1 Tax=Pyrenophora seminiperda CCB06 TaxID=1302712 RepID=A0A3M7M2V5_9PLEO|nr:hypothetical protein GMOD_00002738 [Pyrenophora seminiperda CCB06]
MSLHIRTSGVKKEVECIFSNRNWTQIHHVVIIIPGTYGSIVWWMTQHSVRRILCRCLKAGVHWYAMSLESSGFQYRSGLPVCNLGRHLLDGKGGAFFWTGANVSQNRLELLSLYLDLRSSTGLETTTLAKVSKTAII